MGKVNHEINNIGKLKSLGILTIVLLLIGHNLELIVFVYQQSYL